MNEVSDFLKRHNFEENLDMKTITNILLEDMSNGLKKNHEEISSMDMIPIWKSIARENPHNKNVISIDAGGTNFRTALIKFSDEGTPKIHSFFKYKMPALDYPMTNKDFFDKLAEYLRPLKDQAEYISFCFSFAIKIYPDGSGEAIKLSKEIKLPEIASCKINDELLKALKRDGWASIKKIVMVNDTACVLQAGAINENLEDYSGFVGFVLGTGLNSAYIENGEIEKLQVEDTKSNTANEYTIPDSQIIVCESGKCKKIPQSNFDKELSKKSKLANEYFLERMCSGRYLGELCSIALKTGASEELFSYATKQKLLETGNFTTEEISTFLHANQSKSYRFNEKLKIDNEQDLQKIYKICESIFKRAGILSAGIIASACIKMLNTKKIDANLHTKAVCINADGSVFLKGYSIKENIEKYLDEYLRQEKGINFIIKNTQTPVSLGSAFFAFK